MRSIGKKICNYLRELRGEVARANNINFVETPCTHKGFCKGTCPYCEKKASDLYALLKEKEALGETVVWNVDVDYGSCSDVHETVDSSTEEIDVLPMGYSKTVVMQENTEPCAEGDATEEDDGLISVLDDDMPIAATQGEAPTDIRFGRHIWEAESLSGKVEVGTEECDISTTEDSSDSLDEMHSIDGLSCGEVSDKIPSDEGVVNISPTSDYYIPTFDVLQGDVTIPSPYTTLQGDVAPLKAPLMGEDVHNIDKDVRLSTSGYLEYIGSLPQEECSGTYVMEDGVVHTLGSDAMEDELKRFCEENGYVEADKVTEIAEKYDFDFEKAMKSVELGILKIRALRSKTCLPLGRCKKLLVECDYDYEAALKRARSEMGFRRRMLGAVSIDDIDKES